jgi:cell division protease FtsH
MMILLAVNFAKLMFSAQSAKETIDFPVFIEMVKQKKVNQVTFEEDKRISGTYMDKNGSEKAFVTVGDTKSDLYLSILLKNDIIPKYQEPERPSVMFALLINFGPIILMVIIFLVIFNRARGGAGGITSFGKAKTKLLNESREQVRFSDVAGVDESKEELSEIVDFLRNPGKFTKLGGKLPKGALLVGPPGTGKTMLAKAVATEAGVPFLSMSGSDFVEMFVGVGASRVRDLFDQAKAKAPCIIFIDEIDAVGKARGGVVAGGGGHDERDQTLNQLLVEMDGFDSQSGIIMLAATNRVDVLDPALLRPGRFDRRVVVQLPDVIGREKILKIHAQKTNLSSTASLKQIAKGTAGFSGADLANLINEAALFAARRNQTQVQQIDLEEARDKILMGPQRKSMQFNPDDKKTTAYHEAGHAVIARILNVDPVHKVTIIPRGMALGVTQTLPEDNQLSISKEKAEKMISMLMGGRVAEELVFNHITTGASNDIERATSIARRMVTEWGMSSLGPINYKNEQNQGMNLYAEFSEATRKEVDDEIKKIINHCYSLTKKVLQQQLTVLTKLAEALLEKETLDGAEVEQIILAK